MNSIYFISYRPFLQAIAFSGYSDPNSAISSSNAVYSKLAGTKWISLGGGNSAGYFSATVLNNINNAINSNSFSAYRGIVFDVEEGDSGLYSHFQTCFQSARNKGLSVMVSVSHSGPNSISDCTSLMNSFFKDPNIQYLSPQLYTSGTESSNDYSVASSPCNVPWSSYSASNTKALVVASIVEASYYQSAQVQFQQYGVTLQGYIQWSQH